VSLEAKLPDPRQSVLLYGTTPPRTGSAQDAVRGIGVKLVERLQRLPLDAIVVYDIQDESGRTAAQRPFAFTGTVDPRAYSRLIAELAARPTITYKCVGTMDEAAWDGWLAETARDFGVRFLSIVGRPVSSAGYPLALSRAIRLAAEHRSRFTVGAVVIAERHTQQRSESARMLAKALQGCGYFISQTVYRPHATERLLRDYLRDCRGAGVEPRRVILTFSPVGREKTLTFLQWLGVQVPEETARAIFGAANPLAQSIEICRANLRRILERGSNAAIPIGVNVESVSINRDEIDASIDLAHALKEILDEHVGR
jgi:5,10-methylenetetrahydrofolate reductase